MIVRVLRQLCLVVAFAGGWPPAAVADSQCTFAPDCAPGGDTPPYETVTDTPVSVVACRPAGTTVTTPTFGPYSIPAECPARCGRRQSYDCSYETPCNCDADGNNCSTCTVPQTCSRCVTYSIRLACTGSLRIVYQGVCGGDNWGVVAFVGPGRFLVVYLSDEVLISGGRVRGLGPQNDDSGGFGNAPHRFACTRAPARHQGVGAVRDVEVFAETVRQREPGPIK